ncbi:MAG: BrnT family toxin [Methylococcales bacterium]
MKLSWDEAKRQRTLAERGLDFADAVQVLSGLRETFADLRRDYGEPRFVTVGFLRSRMVVVVHSPRGDTTHIVSMRKANEREIARYKKFVG